MHAPTKRDELTGERPGRRPYPPRPRLKLLAALSVLAPALAMANVASAGSLPWYSIAAACVTMPIAVLQWVTASVPRPSRVLIRLAIVATIVSCVIETALCLYRAMATSQKAGIIIFFLVAPTLVAVVMIKSIRDIARETS